MPPTRSSLLLNLQQENDPGSWRKFVEIYRPLIVHAARQTGVCTQDVDDVVQMVLLQLLKSLPGFSYQRERGFFRSWLRRITINKAIDLGRSRQRLAMRHVEMTRYQDQMKSQSEPDSEFDAEFLQAAMRGIRTEFRTRTWDCFVLKTFGQKSAAEISQELGLSENAVFINTSRVLSRIREFCLLHGEELNHDAHTRLIR